SPGIDLAAARAELVQSPVFSNALISPDGETSALLVSFYRDDTYHELLGERESLRQKRDSEGLDAAEAQRFAQVVADFDRYSNEAAELRSADIAQIRSILELHEDGATLYLGGAPMIADDLVTFVRSDLTS